MKYSSIKFLFLCFLVFALPLTAFSQAPPKAAPKAGPTPKKAAKPAATPTPTPIPGESEDEVLEKAQNLMFPAERTQALKDFLEKFPGSAHKVRVQELIVSARAQDGETKIRSGDVEGGIALFELAVREAPVPLSSQLFNGVVFLIPANLYYLGQGAAAIKIANLIEEKAEGNSAQLLELAKFHLSIENASDGQRAAAKAVAADANSAAGYELLGQAYRMNLQLDEAAAAYEKGLQTPTRLLSSVLYLADAKRALGKPDEALVLYQEALEKEPGNSAAVTGRVMALFDAGKRSDAETELQNALTADPKNFVLMAGAAYWYAAHNEAGKAVDLARKAMAVEPRFVWAHIALARGLLLEKHAVEAERVMLQALQYGSFPTVIYESASAKYAAGFYDEAAADLARSFTIRDDKLEVSLAGRVVQSGDSFIEILARERRASIYESLAADSPESAGKLKNLLAFELRVSEKEVKEADVIAAADAFIGGSDQMQTYRRLYVAGRLLLKKIAPAKALEYAQAAVPGIEAAIDMPGATTAVLADELLPARAAALRQRTTIDVPAIPRPILLSIMRGRVEEASGWALFQQQKPDEALVRLRRAVSVLPENSAWWRSSLWKLGTVLDAGGKTDEAFEAYSKSYANAPPDQARFETLQGLCQKLYGALEGCEGKIAAAAKGDPTLKKGASSLLKAQPAPAPTPDTAAKPVDAASGGETGAAPVPTPTPAPAVEPVNTKPSPTPEATPTPQPSPAAEIQTTQTSEPLKEPQKAPEETAKPEPAATPTPEPAAKDEVAKNEVAKSEEGRKRKVTPKPETENKTGDDKGSVVYSNPNAQVRVRSLSSENDSACQITVSPEKLILISNGGWGSVTIDLKGEGKLEDIKVSTENPEDLVLELQAGIGKDIGRVLYVVRSISSKKGEFKVFVESPCGEKKEVLITVR